MIDPHDATRVKGCKADLQHPMGRSARMEDGASSSLAVRVDQRVNLGVEVGLCKGHCHQFSLPGAITVFAPVLQRAPAADSEVRTNRCDALSARLLDPQQMTPIGVALPLFDLNDLAR